jgi:hypothetical protein
VVWFSRSHSFGILGNLRSVTTFIYKQEVS